MKNIKNLFLSAILVLSAASCTLTGTLEMPDDDGPVDGLYLLEKVYENGALSLQFEYNGKNQITKITFFYYAPPLECVFRYNSSGDVSSIDGIVNFSKSEDAITADYGGGFTNKIHLNSAGLPDMVTYSDGTIDICRYDNDGNLASRSYKGRSWIFDSYDTKKAPFYNCETPHWFLIYWVDMCMELYKLNEIEEDYDLGILSFATDMRYKHNPLQAGNVYFIYEYNSAGYVKTRKLKNIDTDIEYTADAHRYEYLVK
jgi:predicted small lipoprotein YifL